MNKKEVLGQYQDDAANPNEGEREQDDLLRATEEREQVEEVLGMPGYMIMHRLITERISESIIRLQDLSLPESSLRFEQGVIRGLSTVQKRFVNYRKDVREGRDE